ncbi:hypothetical protein C0J52_09514 [Blattella germanica]|nr:hypothetical protein C0J52_09514 [Blattella germanica]
MPLAQREVLQLCLLLLCVPAQYLLSGNIGTGDGRSQAVMQLVNEVRHLRDSWFKLESWKARWMQLVSWVLEGVIQPENIINKYSFESPAIEVLRYRERAGYFATSKTVRHERPSHLRYRVGQVVKHRVLGYRGVIVGWDLEAKAPETWLLRIYGNRKTFRSWPHYAVLVDERDHSGSRVTYVVQEQLELMKNTEVHHSDLKENFEYFDGAQYIPRERLRTLYPKD